MNWADFFWTFSLSNIGKMLNNLSITKHFSEAQPSFWAGWWDKPTEGTFSDVNTGNPLTETMFQPWYLGEPNGDTLENCAIVWPERNSWNDVECDRMFCGFCEFEKAPDLMIRGNHNHNSK